jgi:hypothetical protein
MYLTSTVDWFPEHSSVDGKRVLGFAPAIRQGLHKSLWTSHDAKFMLLMGAEAEIAISGAKANGGAVMTLAWSFAGPLALVLSPRAIRTPDNSVAFAPQVGLFWRVGK